MEVFFMPIETIPGGAMTYHLIAYDADGRERPDDPAGLMSQLTAQVVHDKPVTDVFLLSHGWRGDIPGAREQYGRWIGAMAACSADIARMKEKRPGFLPLLIGLHWPSEPWGDDTFSNVESFSVGSVDPAQALIENVAEKIVDTPAARAAIGTIVSAAFVDNNPSELPPRVKEAYHILDRETGLGHGGAAAPPGDDREAFDAESLYQDVRTDGVSFSGFSDGVLAPLRVLSFWKMKDRARQFGETGAHQLLLELMRASAGRDVKFHLMGHSFGCIAVSAAVTGPAGSPLPAPVGSIALIQGALSLWSYCSDIPPVLGTAGYFHRLVAEQKARGPIITTQSIYDRAVGTWYPWAAGAKSQVSFAPGELPKYGAVGAFGIQGPGADSESRMILKTDHAYGFEPGKLYNIECSGVINEGGGFSGAHSDIAKPEVAHAVWEAAMA
jgi:hypothetical protein